MPDRRALRWTECRRRQNRRRRARGRRIGESRCAEAAARSFYKKGGKPGPVRRQSALVLRRNRLLCSPRLWNCAMACLSGRDFSGRVMAKSTQDRARSATERTATVCRAYLFAEESRACSRFLVPSAGCLHCLLDNLLFAASGPCFFSRTPATIRRSLDQLPALLRVPGSGSKVAMSAARDAAVAAARADNRVEMYP